MLFFTHSSQHPSRMSSGSRAFRIALHRILIAGGLWFISQMALSVVAQDTTTDVPAEQSADSTEPNAGEPADAPEDVVQEQSSSWEYVAPIIAPTGGSSSNLIELKLGPEVFSQARPDLADLRLFTASGKAHPYALRVLAKKSVRDVVPTTEFNRLEQDNGTRELTLELPSDQFQHNEVQVETSGTSFRRSVQVDGSSDGQTWRSLNEGHLIRFEYGDQKINVTSIEYPDSRFQFVRVRVQPDLDPEANDDSTDEFSITSVKVLRTVELPGERSEWPGVVGPREPTRVLGAPGSAWIIDLNGKNVPVDRIEFDVANGEFVRDVEIQVETLSDYLGQPVFTTAYTTGTTTWQRKAGESKKLMSIEFSEVQTSRLRLLVSDYRNVPLTIRSAKVSAAARQLVIPQNETQPEELKLYFGNPLAEPANYDFARNLPAELASKPAAATLAAVSQNPDFVPPPLPLTERLPWLVYAVLGTVSLVLLLIIGNLAKTAVALHEAQA